MSLQPAATCGAQHAKAVAEAPEQPVDAEQRHTGRRQLDRQWQAVELPAQRTDRSHVRARQREAPVSGLRSSNEQCDCAIVHRSLG